MILSYLKNNLANYFTMANLASGFFGIILVMEQDYAFAFACIFISLLLDFFDGFIARMTKTSSEIGKDLDSLADGISFGVLPGLMAYQILPEKICYLALLIPLFSIWRLAKFNHDIRDSHYFYGLPTPANALCISAIYFDFEKKGYSHLNPEWFELLFPVYIILSAILLVSNVKLLSNKTNFKLLAHNVFLLLIPTISIACVLIFGAIGLSFAVIWYVLFSIIYLKFSK